MKTSYPLVKFVTVCLGALLYAATSFAASTEQTQLEQAIRQGNTAEIKSLLSQSGQGLDLAEAYIFSSSGDDKLPALCYAALIGHLPTVELLATACGVDALTKHISKLGLSPLHFAAKGGHLAVVIYLLDKCPDLIQQVDSRSWSALSYAASEVKCEAAECLLFRRAEVDHRTNFNSTPLILSSQKARADIALPSMLMAAKADVNATDRYGRTALAQAVKSNNSALVELFLGNQELAPNHRETALDMALAEGRKDVALLLLKGQEPEVIIGKFKSAASLDELVNKVAKKYRIILDNDGAETRAFVSRFLDLIEPLIEGSHSLAELSRTHANAHAATLAFPFLLDDPLAKRVSQQVAQIFAELKKNTTVNSPHFPRQIQASLGESVKAADLNSLIKAEIQQHLRALFSEVSGAGTEEQLLDIIQARILGSKNLENIRDFEKTIEPWFDILHGAELLPSRASLEKTLFELRKKWFLENELQKTACGVQSTPVVIKGTCAACLENFPVICVAGTHDCTGKMCTGCAGDHLSSIIKHPDETPKCQTCNSAALAEVYVRCGCSVDMIDKLKEIQYRQQQEMLPGWQFCHGDGCVDGRVFAAGEPKRFACSLCSFSGCLGCGFEHGTESYNEEGNCRRVELMSTKYCDMLLKQGKRRPIVLAELPECPVRIEYDKLLAQHAAALQSEKCPRCPATIGGLSGHSVLDHVRSLIEGHLEQLTREHVVGNVCPVCQDQIDDKHAINDHIHDGRSRPCPFCGMVTEKIPLQEGGYCNHMKCQNQACGRDFNFHTGKSAPHEAARTMDAQRYELEEELVAWWPGTRGTDGAAGGGRAH